ALSVDICAGRTKGGDFVATDSAIDQLVSALLSVEAPGRPRANNRDWERVMVSADLEDAFGIGDDGEIIRLGERIGERFEFVGGLNGIIVDDVVRLRSEEGVHSGEVVSSNSGGERIGGVLRGRKLPRSVGSKSGEAGEE